MEIRDKVITTRDDELCECRPKVQVTGRVGLQSVGANKLASETGWLEGHAVDERSDRDKTVAFYLQGEADLGSGSVDRSCCSVYLAAKGSSHFLGTFFSLSSLSVEELKRTCVAWYFSFVRLKVPKQNSFLFREWIPYGERNEKLCFSIRARYQHTVERV